MSTLRVCPTIAATPDLLIAVAAAATTASTIAELPMTLIDLLVIEFPDYTCGSTAFNRPRIRRSWHV